MVIDFEDTKIRHELIYIAKRSLDSIHSSQNLVMERSLREKYSERYGVFTTIKLNGQLRGCIGFVEPIYPLWEAIWKSARYAATEDPRFLPMTADEIAHAEIELTILGRLLPLPKDDRSELSRIILGKHGLVVRRGYMSGLLLPQVAVELGLTKNEFLRETAIKAGINPRLLDDDQTETYFFDGIVIK